MAEGWNQARSSCRSNKLPHGNNCSSSMNTTNNHNRSTNTCRFYLQGRCCFGSECRFSHQQPQNSCSSNDNNNSNSANNLANQISTVLTIDDSPSTSISSQSKSKSGEKSHKKSGKVGNSHRNDKAETKLADFVNAPEFVPKSQAFKSYATAVEPSSVNHHTDGDEVLLCPFAMIGECRYGEQCVYLHGDACDLCGKCCLHPTDIKQRKQHMDECLKEHERDMEMSFAVQRSQDKCCGICMDTVVEKESVNERRFGILENCNHVFCLSCIRKWRSAKQFENKIVRACPECRVCSDFVTPSAYWVEAQEDKAKLIENYKKALGKKPCKYFMQGRGECPFAGNCFYLHAYPDGRIAELPPPQARRRRTNQHGEYDVLANNSLLWDFIDERDSRYMFFELEEMLDIMMESDDDSDYSDFEFYLP